MIIFDRFCWAFFSATCVYPDILCIIRCLQSEIAILQKTRATFLISGHRTAITSVQLITKSGATSLPDTRLTGFGGG